MQAEHVPPCVRWAVRKHDGHKWRRGFTGSMREVIRWLSPKWKLLAIYNLDNCSLVLQLINVTCISQAMSRSDGWVLDCCTCFSWILASLGKLFEGWEGAALEKWWDRVYFSYNLPGVMCLVSFLLSFRREYEKAAQFPPQSPHLS